MCVYAGCASNVGLCERVWGESVSLGARRGLGCLLPADFLIAMEILNLCVSGVRRCSQGTHKHSFSHKYIHTHTPQRLGTGCRKLSSTSLEGRPLVKELPEGVCVLKFFGGSELIVCFQSHYYDRLFTERGRLQLLSALLLVPQYKQPQQHNLLFLMKSTSFLSTYLQHSLHHTLELLASLKAT